MTEIQLTKYLVKVSQALALALEGMEEGDTVKAYENFSEAYRLFSTSNFDVSRAFQNTIAAEAEAKANSPFLNS